MPQVGQDQWCNKPCSPILISHTQNYLSWPPSIQTIKYYRNLAIRRLWWLPGNNHSWRAQWTYLYITGCTFHRYRLQKKMTLLLLRPLKLCVRLHYGSFFDPNVLVYKKILYFRKDMIKSTYLLMTTLLGLIRLIINYTQGQRPCFQNKDATKMRIYLNNECITILSKKYREIYKETKNQTLRKTETYSTLSIILF